MAEEVWKTIYPQLDPQQFGNVKGFSCLHYLVDYIDFVSSNVDKMNVVAAVTIDLSKAIDLIDHNILIRKFLIHEPGEMDCLLYQRSNWQQEQEAKSLPNSPYTVGYPQGTVLAPLLFIMMVNEDWDPTSRIYR